MPNIVPIQTVIAKKVLARLQNKLPMMTNVNRDYQDLLSDSSRRDGGIINITKPPLFNVRSGEIMEVQSTVIPSISTNLVMKGVDVSASQLDLQITYDEVESGMIDGTLDGAASALAAQVETDLYNQYVNVANTVGTPGTPITDPGVLATAGALITSNGATLDANARIGVLNSFQNASFATGVKNYFNPTQVVNKAYADGRLGSGYGFDLYDDPVAGTHTAGTYGGSPIIVSASGNTIVTSGWSAASFLNPGDTFTIAGVFNRNTQTKTSTGNLKFFVAPLGAVADGSGNMTITIGEDGIIADGSPRQNVVTAPAPGAAITVTSGASGVTSKQSLVFDRNAFTLAVVPIAKLPAGLGAQATVVKDKMSGLSISMKQGYIMGTNQLATRFDILYSTLTTYGQVAARILG